MRYKLKRDPPRRVLSSTDLDMNFDEIRKSSYWIAIYIKSLERRVTKRPSNVKMKNGIFLPPFPILPRLVIDVRDEVIDFHTRRENTLLDCSGCHTMKGK